MQDVFITKLPAAIDSWTKAFPQSTFSAIVPENLECESSKSKASEAYIFWLHINQDRQQWVESTITTIMKNYQGAKIVVLANVPNHTESIHALKLGAVGYCHAYIAPDVLKEVKAVVSHGGLWVGQDVLQALIETSTKLVTNRPEQVEALLDQLTKREKEVALEAAKGSSNKEIARVLSITERTVKAHLASTFECLGVKDRLQLALMLNGNYKH